MTNKKIRLLNKRQIKFILIGIANVFITNFFLQLFLLHFSTSISTLISQHFNIFLGLNLYGKHVFKVKKLRKRNIIRYFLVAYLLWIANWVSIDLIYTSFGFSKNLSALFVLPVLALISYLVQKLFIFKE
tara:strand:+ start:352 stop:741 length:390 start_codon:yes stop_codon:yes gene_type:complete